MPSIAAIDRRCFVSRPAKAPTSPTDKRPSEPPTFTMSWQPRTARAEPKASGATGQAAV
ncbi:hypothetical protein [Phenylobacterium sp.]|uniref:hypothetical protein n=1 Tax=Phenylobacterium sp. TaxID=1871053 RepID=UPI003D2DD5DB